MLDKLVASIYTVFMKSTHKGHCQVCGGLQMLPGGTLSLHGYKVTYGFFSGICHGAKAKPFEQAHDLVDEAIVRAQEPQVRPHTVCLGSDCESQPAGQEQVWIIA